MSKENVKKFFEELGKNETFKKKYMDLMQKSQNETESELSGKLVEMAGAADVPFTVEELHDARTELIEAMNENGELAEEELMAVSGGAANNKGLMIAMSVLTLGIGCAGVSAVGEMLQKGQCKKVMDGDFSR